MPLRDFRGIAPPLVRPGLDGSANSARRRMLVCRVFSEVIPATSTIPGSGESCAPQPLTRGLNCISDRRVMWFSGEYCATALAARLDSKSLKCVGMAVDDLWILQGWRYGFC